jgi:hypothetical protein
MTIEQLQKLPSYTPLKRNGFTDANIMEYYTLSTSERSRYFNQIKNGGSQQLTQTPSEPQGIGTQKCTSVSVASVRRMAMEMMDKDFVVDGVTYNMNKLGWIFSMNTNKSRFGVCKKRLSRRHSRELMRMEYVMTIKRIELSQWMVVNSDTPYEKWIDTMLHEIAHAIDSEINADCRSSHGYKWVRIAKMIGCNGERCGNAKVDAKASKYTLKCNSCGKESASHKRKKRVSACGDCCRKYNGGRYDSKYALEQIQNY